MREGIRRQEENQKERKGHERRREYAKGKDTKEEELRQKYEKRQQKVRGEDRRQEGERRWGK